MSAANQSLDSFKIKLEPQDHDDKESPAQKQASETHPSIGSDQKDDRTDISLANKSKTSVHVTVHRSEISATTVEEGNEELEELDVEVYDQRTYEQGVFEQCNKALSVSSSYDTTGPTKSSNDLVNLLQSTDDTDPESSETANQEDHDEQILKLTRLQRFQKSTIKDTPLGSDHRSYKNLSKIPRIPKNSSTIVGSADSPKKSQILRQDKRIEDPPCADAQRSENKNENDSKDLDESASDEYDEDFEFESDNDETENENETRRKGRKVVDDGDVKCYQARMKTYTRAKALERLQNISDDGTEITKINERIQIDGDLYIPKDIWDNLFEHQKTGVRWLWELQQLGTGGILGDEMGLGKTIQMLAFLAALRTSNVTSAHKGYENLGPTILVCPATVMHQWLMELHKWWPPFRVAILHSTGTYCGDRKDLIQVINKSRGILIVSYPGVVIYQDFLHSFTWHYVILDEGHKIRNPDAQVTLACKRFRTPHRIILSGSPVQNNLKELWSIFDFIYPGKLGTLPVFMEQFATPITQGGYANASDIQVQIAYKCSCVLRDTIKPFLLRRTKAEVNNRLKLPDRSEQVLFCKLTEKQRKYYKSFLESPTVRDIKAGFCQIFVGLIELRKICNHPDLFDSTDCQDQIKQSKEAPKKKHMEFFSADETFGHYKKSGKMMVVDALLKLWKSQGHKVLLFTQSRQMIRLFTNYMIERKYQHMVMDGSTPIISRQAMIEEFNKNEEIFIFLLTTRVGGVGVNLTGANRIIIYDPDWNPSTDIQARERAWRIGQQRHVVIYRLLTAGTIEEKIYHRQVFKLYLTNRILKDAKQKRFFKTNDMHELFTLGDNDNNIETKALFDDNLQISLDSIKRSRKQRKLRKKRHRNSVESSGVQDVRNLLSDEKLDALREQAKRLSRMIAMKYGSTSQAETDEPQAQLSTPNVGGNNDCDVLLDKACHNQTEVRVIIEPEVKEGVASKRTDRGIALCDEAPVGNKQHFEYLVKQDVYRSLNSTDIKRKKRHDRDDYILERLFKNSNIFGALKHDKIETDSTSDFKVIESEADKVARDAIRALKESRRLCLDSSMGVPNWTGRNGQVAAKPRLVPKNKSRTQFTMKVGTSSSSNDSLLSSIKQRNQSNPVALARSAFSTPLDSDEEEDRNKDFEGKADGTGANEIADALREYLLFKSARSGEAQTDDLLGFFKSKFSSDKTAIFKAILYKMCKFERRGNKGFWLINSEFRDL